MGLFSRRPRERGKRVFFATDIHGSEACFRKLLAAGDAYAVTDLILGGDITGKMMVPVVDDGSGRFSCRYGDNVYTALDVEGKREVVGLIRRFGHYPIVGTREDLLELADPATQAVTFRKLVFESVVNWVTLAEERLKGTGRRLFIAPGNDDFLEIDSALEGSDSVVFAENQCLALDDLHEMITTGYSNPTPWETERELPEDQLLARLNGMARHVRDEGNLVAVIHPPPFDTPIDHAPQLDSEFNVHVQAGGMVMAPVGSTAVRAFIEHVQPLIGLHGHVHEGGGVARLGRTLCLNPGSEYTQGTLAGAIVELGDGAVISYQFVTA